MADQFNDLEEGQSFVMPIVRGEAYVYLTPETFALGGTAGSPVEIALLQHRPRFTGQRFTVHKSTETAKVLISGGVNAEQTMVELGGIRVPPTTALDLAVSLLSHMVSNEMISAEDVSARFQVAGMPVRLGES